MPTATDALLIVSGALHIALTGCEGPVSDALGGNLLDWDTRPAAVAIA
jgi:hypothetical protein